MLIEFNEKMIATAIKYQLSLISKIDLNSNHVELDMFNLEDLINGNFKDNTFSHDENIFILPFSLNFFPVYEIISNRSFIFDAYHLFIEKELQIKDFSIKESFPSKKEGFIQTVNFYIN